MRFGASGLEYTNFSPQETDEACDISRKSRQWRRRGSTLGHAVLRLGRRNSLTPKDLLQATSTAGVRTSPRHHCILTLDLHRNHFIVQCHGHDNCGRICVSSPNVYCGENDLTARQRKQIHAGAVRPDAEPDRPEGLRLGVLRAVAASVNVNGQDRPIRQLDSSPITVNGRIDRESVVPGGRRQVLPPSPLKIARNPPPP